MSDKITYSGSKFYLYDFERKIFKNPLIKVVVLSLSIIVAEVILSYFEFYNEVFNGADILYHIVFEVVGIGSQLSYSIIAAIIFYYVIEVIDSKRNIKRYNDVENHLEFIKMGVLELLSAFKLIPLDIHILDHLELDKYYQENIANVTNKQLFDSYKSIVNSNPIFIKSKIKFINQNLDIIKNKSIGYGYLGNSAYLLESLEESLFLMCDAFDYTDNKNEMTDTWKSVFIGSFINVVLISYNAYKDIEHHNSNLKKGKYINCLKYY